MDWPGEKLLTRLWETVAEKGIGSLLRPWQIRREGSASIDVRRNELLMLAQTEQDVAAIRSGRKLLAPPKGVFQSAPILEPVRLPSEPTIDLQALAQNVSNRVVADALRREVNVARALIASEAELQSDPQEPPSSRVNEDWLFRWRDYAGAVSVEDLQGLWGRLLAGEVKAPGTFSLRTLEFLKNLSSQEAAEIAKLSPFVIGNNFIARIENILTAEGITFSYLLRMQELGVLSGADTIGLHIQLPSTKPESFFRALVSHGRALVVKAEDANRRLELPEYQITTIGRELIRLGAFEANERYLRAVGESIRDSGFDVTLARCQDVTDTEVTLVDEQPL